MIKSCLSFADFGPEGCQHIQPTWSLHDLWQVFQIDVSMFSLEKKNYLNYFFLINLKWLCPLCCRIVTLICLWPCLCRDNQRAKPPLSSSCSSLCSSFVLFSLLSKVVVCYGFDSCTLIPVILVSLFVIFCASSLSHWQDLLCPVIL